MCDWRKVHSGQRPLSLRALHTRACSDGRGRCKPAQRWAFLAPSPESAVEGQARASFPGPGLRGEPQVMALGRGESAGRVSDLFLFLFCGRPTTANFPGVAGSLPQCRGHGLGSSCVHSRPVQSLCPRQS